MRCGEAILNYTWQWWTDSIFSVIKGSCENVYQDWEAGRAECGGEEKVYARRVQRQTIWGQTWSSSTGTVIRKGVTTTVIGGWSWLARVVTGTHARAQRTPRQPVSDPFQNTQTE